MKVHKCPCGETNPENFYAKARGECKFCARKRYKKWQNENIFQYRFISARNRAKYAKLPIDIDAAYLEELYNSQGGLCYYCGRPMLLSIDQRGNISLSVDRIDSKKGYVRGNVVLCLNIMNIMKSDLTTEEFIQLCHDVAIKNPDAMIDLPLIGNCPKGIGDFNERDSTDRTRSERG